MSHALTGENHLQTSPDSATSDLIQEPQDVIGDADTQEDSPNPNNPPEPENDLQTPETPQKSKYNLRRNPTSNWKPDFSYYNAIEANPANSINPNNGPDDCPEAQVLADLRPDGGLKSDN